MGFRILITNQKKRFLGPHIFLKKYGNGTEHCPNQPVRPATRPILCTAQGIAVKDIVGNVVPFRLTGLESQRWSVGRNPRKTIEKWRKSNENQRKMMIYIDIHPGND